MPDNQSYQFSESERLYSEAIGRIPTASQTFSKSRLQFPAGITPDFLTHGEGGRVWDVDGNEYVDVVMGLLANVLGYCDPDVDQAIEEQLRRGISFSLATPLESEVAERLVDIIPCAEMVRFGKNATDATSAAVRIARAATRRRSVFALGYHGWQDWYVGATTRNKGVPDEVGALTTRLPFNDIDAVSDSYDKLNGDVACIILEPMSAEEPRAGYLQALREFATTTNTILVFDETVTGFRFALGGAQELFGVVPDLTVLGKGIANGMPLSAIVGRADLMREFEEIFFSGTFGGEALSLAAAKAVIDKYRREPVIEALWDKGKALHHRLNEIVNHYNLEEAVTLRGKPPWKICKFDAFDTASREEIETFIVTRMVNHGVLFGGSFNLCYAHSDEELDHIVSAFDATLASLSEEVQAPGLAERLGCDLIQPVFRVRS